MDLMRVLSFACLFLTIFYFGQKKNEFVTTQNIKGNTVLYYQIKSDDPIFDAQIVRLEMFSNVSSLEAGQKLISYDYCQSIKECERSYMSIENGKRSFEHYEMTGYISKNDSLWLHPPRADSFKILELNAFPFYIKNKKEWQYVLNFGDTWADEKWRQWKGSRTSLSNYIHDETPVFYIVQKKEVECTLILASTKIPNLGETTSVFYYNAEYGFVRMIFTTINNKVIEFNLIKTVYDPDSF
ncbi:hypothetical protein C1637_17480 [Chryseobacterium lactis]|uniref:GLPGLI family protein n=2 Tax=Chryseobacterium lactis TaxID=1241981 RepID=A0A3G6RMP1_CHRLC|nr:hypothetical protein EG342_14270 [Chryseobacterium lactis]AZB03354.1 hypothetical protein EG341_05135 [Chryseobacterium lactis]PNW12360.1 hypothetical protein C1637_17480 [Chryseobacterium lactis]